MPHDAPIDEEEIKERMRHGWTGNRTHDLAGFELGEEFEVADAEWHLQALRRQREHPYR